MLNLYFYIIKMISIDDSFQPPGRKNSNGKLTLTIATEDGLTQSIEVYSWVTVEELRATLKSTFNILNSQQNQMRLFIKNTELIECSSAIIDYQVENNDTILVYMQH